MKNNLNAKCITEFTPEDTIYIRKAGKNNSHVYLCKFVSYRSNKVTGIAISTEVNPKLHEHEINSGLEITASIDNCSLYGQNPVDGRTYYHWFMPSGYAIYPKDFGNTEENSELIKEHPSFGMVRLSRRNSRGTVLFGSSITHNEIIAITIAKGNVDRDLNREWYHAGDELVEIEMSANQFAEFITTPNTGSGIPCTLRHVGRERMPEPPYESKKDMFSREFEIKMKNISSDLTENLKIAKQILEKPSIGKGDREELIKLFEKFISNVGSNIPFMEKSFVEQMDKTVTEAKAEIDAFIHRRITDEGRKVLLGESGEQKLIN